MRFLVDECAGPALAQWLLEQGHEVFSVFDEARGAADADLLSKAHDEGWILITADRDFGERIFRDGMAHQGVIFMRLVDHRAANKIAVMQRLLASHGGRIAGRFVVVSESAVRIAGEPA